MRTLFLFLLLFAAAPAVAQLHFTATTLDAGAISEDDSPREYRFGYVNDSDKPVVILRVETTCGCAKPRYSKEPVMPGAKGAVGVTFYPEGHPGVLERSVYVYTSAAEKPIQLKLSGQVAPTRDKHPQYPLRIGELRLKQTDVRFGVVCAPRRVMARVEVLNEGSRAMRLSVTGAPAWLEFSTEPAVIAPDSVGDLVFVCDPEGLKPGKIEAQVVLDGVRALPSERILTVSAEVR